MSEVIDDKWAAVWPRRWVMVRDDGSDPWKGPYRLLGRAVYCSWEYVTDRGPFGQCRPATPEEIATVEPAQQPEPKYRLLEDGEIVLHGDEYQHSEFGWLPTKRTGYRLRSASYRPHRRPVGNQPIKMPLEEANPSDEMARYLELKLLAEMAWAALLSSPTDGKAKWFAEFSWNAAEAMYAESERRRPK